MAELTLEALGYRPDEARVARRSHDLLQEPQDPNAPLPAWLHQPAPWSVVALDTSDTLAGTCAEVNP